MLWDMCYVLGATEFVPLLKAHHNSTLHFMATENDSAYCHVLPREKKTPVEKRKFILEAKYVEDILVCKDF